VPYSVQVLGSQVTRHSAHFTGSHELGDRLLLFSNRSVAMLFSWKMEIKVTTFATAEHHHPFASAKLYCL